MENDGAVRQVAFTKEQYEVLLKLVYLGNWVANAHRDGSKDDPLVQEYEDFHDLIFSLAPAFGLEKYVAHEVSDGTRYYPTREFEEDTGLHDLIDEYNENVFWEELPDALAERDFHAKYTDEEIDRMDAKENIAKFYECIDFWENELVEFGVDRLAVGAGRASS